jgi:hypothetical protein
MLPANALTWAVNFRLAWNFSQNRKDPRRIRLSCALACHGSHRLHSRNAGRALLAPGPRPLAVSVLVLPSKPLTGQLFCPVLLSPATRLDTEGNNRSLSPGDRPSVADYRRLDKAYLHSFTVLPILILSRSGPPGLRCSPVMPFLRSGQDSGSPHSHLWFSPVERNQLAL